MMNNVLRPYELRQVNDIPWIERIPAHWDVQRVKAVYKKLNRPTRSNDEVITCFRDGVVTLRKNRRTTGFTESIKEIGYQGVRKGDLVIHVMDAFAGAIGVSDSDGKGTPVYSVCEAKVDLNNYYYAYVIREMAKTGFIQSLYRGIRERSSDFRFEVFANQYLPIPPRTEQDQIVRYLDHQLAKINKFIKAKKKLIAVLKEQKQAIINEAVTRGLDPNVKMKASGIEWLGDVPEHWGIAAVKYFAKSNQYALTESTDENREIRYLEIGSVGFGELKSEPGKYIFKESPSRARRIVNRGDTIVSTVRTYLKSMLYIDENLQDCIVSTGFCVLSPLKSVFPELLSYILTSNYFVSMVSQNSIGISYPSISESKIISLKIAIPKTIAEQEEILKHIIESTQEIDSAICNFEKEIELITEYKNSLISDVVTGKVDVRNIAIEELEEEIIEGTELDEDSTDDESLEAEDGDE